MGKQPVKMPFNVQHDADRQPGEQEYTKRLMDAHNPVRTSLSVIHDAIWHDAKVFAEAHKLMNSRRVANQPEAVCTNRQAHEQVARKKRLNDLDPMTASTSGLPYGRKKNLVSLSFEVGLGHIFLSWPRVYKVPVLH